MRQKIFIQEKHSTFFSWFDKEERRLTFSFLQSVTRKDSEKTVCSSFFQYTFQFYLLRPSFELYHYRREVYLQADNRELFQDSKYQILCYIYRCKFMEPLKIYFQRLE